MTLKVWRSTNKVNAIFAVDAMNKPLFPVTDGTAGPVEYLWFLDLEPEANWAHDCLYLFGDSCVRGTWPPGTCLMMVEL